MNKLLSFTTVEDFWRFWNNYPRPSEIMYDGPSHAPPLNPRRRDSLTPSRHSCPLWSVKGRAAVRKVRAWPWAYRGWEWGVSSGWTGTQVSPAVKRSGWQLAAGAA